MGSSLEEALGAGRGTVSAAPESETVIQVDRRQAGLTKHEDVRGPGTIGIQASVREVVVVAWRDEDRPSRFSEPVLQEGPGIRRHPVVLVEISRAQNGIGVDLPGQIQDLHERLADLLTAAPGAFHTGPCEGRVEMKIGENE